MSMLIVLEGLDGAGKTTCAKALAAAMDAQYMTTPAPALRSIQPAILDSLGACQEARQLFYLATVFAAAEHVRTMLATGTSVVMDRYFLSTQVYAEARGARLGLDALGDQLLPATWTVYLDAPLSVRRARLAKRDSTAADRETLMPATDALLRSLYLQKSTQAVAGRFALLDVACATREQVVEQVCRTIGQLREPGTP